MQKRGIKRFEDFAFRSSMASSVAGLVGFNIAAKHRHQGTAPFNYNCPKKPQLQLQILPVSLSILCLFSRRGSSGLLTRGKGVSSSIINSFERV
jgi:hypothetical protein